MYAAPEGRRRGENGGMTIRKPRLGRIKDAAELSAPPILFFLLLAARSSVIEMDALAVSITSGMSAIGTKRTCQ